MKSYSSREVLKMLLDDGWYEVNCVGDHHQFKHPTKPGRGYPAAPSQRLGYPRFEKHCETVWA